MSLNLQDFVRMQYLLGKARAGSLSFEEESELRNLIVHEQPSVQTSSTEELINTGLILVGLYLLVKAFEKKN